MRLNSLNANFPSKGLYSNLNPQPVEFTRNLPTGGFVEVDAFAKINLFLAVVGKRTDGYHDLVSVMQTINLRDRLVISKCAAQETPVKLEVNIPNLPTDDTNLVVKAAKLLMGKYNICEPVHITLEKRIPMGAGLGGGSSNCAATLHGLNKLFDLNIPLNKLMELGKTLGADVPFCLMGGTALAEGIGEKLTPLPPYPHCYVVLACPNIHVSTGEIFGRIGHHFPPANIEKFMSAYESGDITRIAQNFENTFTPITAELYPQISTLITDLQNQGALGACMTGTGSAVFAYFNDENKAQKACNILQHTHKNTKFFSIG